MYTVYVHNAHYHYIIMHIVYVHNVEKIIFRRICVNWAKRVLHYDFSLRLYFIER